MGVVPVRAPPTAGRGAAARDRVCGEASLSQLTASLCPPVSAVVLRAYSEIRPWVCPRKVRGLGNRRFYGAMSHLVCLLKMCTADGSGLGGGQPQPFCSQQGGSAVDSGRESTESPGGWAGITRSFCAAGSPLIADAPATARRAKPPSRRLPSTKPPVLLSGRCKTCRSDSSLSPSVSFAAFCEFCGTAVTVPFLSALMKSLSLTFWHDENVRKETLCHASRVELGL